MREISWTPLLIDVREYPEYTAGHIDGATLIPLGTLAAASAAWDREQPLTLVCRSGQRAEKARSLLAAEGFTSLTLLEGGVDAWKNAGKPLVTLARRPWSLERQVRAVAGSLVLLTLGLAYLVSRFFLLGTALVGAGLLFAGVSDICMMASVLGRMPWNRAPNALASLSRRTKDATV